MLTHLGFSYLGTWFFELCPVLINMMGTAVSYGPSLGFPCQTWKMYIFPWDRSRDGGVLVTQLKERNSLIRMALATIPRAVLNQSHRVKRIPLLSIEKFTHPVRIDAINLAKLLEHPLGSSDEGCGALKLFDLCDGCLCGFLVCHC